MKHANEENPIVELVINYVRLHQCASVKSSDLVSNFHKLAGGNPMTVEARLSRCLARMFKNGLLNRKRVQIAPGFDGTRWVYGYDEAHK